MNVIDITNIYSDIRKMSDWYNQSYFQNKQIIASDDMNFGC